MATVVRLDGIVGKPLPKGCPLDASSFIYISPTNLIYPVSPTSKLNSLPKCAKLLNLTHTSWSVCANAPT